MTSIGETLQRERLRRGWNLERVAAETKISPHLLEAIEADQFERLPGGVFARNFIRQYARMLQIDEEEMVAAFHQQFEESSEQPPEPAPPSIQLPRMISLAELGERLAGPSSSLSAFVGLVVVILVCAGVYSVWQKTRQGAQATTAAAGKRSQVAAKAAPVFRPAEVSDTGTIRVPAPPKPVATVPAAATTEKEAPAAAMRVALTATEPVWVSIKSDGTRTYTGTLEGEKTREFSAARKMTVLVGSAGSLDISLNGKPVGPFGPKGEIRLIVLTPSGAHVVPRTPPTPPPTSEDSTAPTEPVAASDRP